MEVDSSLQHVHVRFLACVDERERKRLPLGLARADIAGFHDARAHSRVPMPSLISLTYLLLLPVPFALPPVFGSLPWPRERVQ
jgi:hypothetical protein